MQTCCIFTEQSAERTNSPPPPWPPPQGSGVWMLSPQSRNLQHCQLWLRSTKQNTLHPRERTDDNRRAQGNIRRQTVITTLGLIPPGTCLDWVRKVCSPPFIICIWTGVHKSMGKSNIAIWNHAKRCHLPNLGVACLVGGNRDNLRTVVNFENGNRYPDAIYPSGKEKRPGPGLGKVHFLYLMCCSLMHTIH